MAARDIDVGPPPDDAAALNTALATHVAAIDADGAAREFLAQGYFLVLNQFLPESLLGELIAAANAAQTDLNRNYLPGHKQGGSVSRHSIDRLAPFIAALYRSPALLRFLERVCGERLEFSPPDDPHAYALYYYSRPGDHIGWHYDTSYYKGRRYTLLLGVVDSSSCRLEYQLHTREAGRPIVEGAVRIPPGGLVFFDGDKLRHRITPIGEGEYRVSLTFEYVTDPNMHAWWRLISNMKDAVAYFGFRQVFRRLTGRARNAQ
ncbi:MAG TPA: hypothetical protein VGI93_06790 [Steroidobacteraceae bacterium]|jgi:hypothetical protein